MASDRLTHPTVFAVEFVLVLVLVLVLEWNVWFWCVRGRVEWAMRRCEESWGQPRQEVVWPSDRLTHPTVFAVELVLEWNAWFWCVRGRIDGAIGRDGA